MKTIRLIRFCYLKLLTVLIGFTLFNAAVAQVSQDPGIVAEVFDEAKVEGTLVIASIGGDILYTHNSARSRERLSPASTFKVINTLIALDNGVVSSEDSQFRWDGTKRDVAAWNKDQTLKSAFSVSCVWCYQEIARSIGSEKYVEALAEANYGDQQIGDEVDQFWLNGALNISAREQVGFLSRLLTNSTTFHTAHIDILKSIMHDGDSPNDYSIFAKTGWTGSELAVGWYIGYVEKDNDVWLFALNIRMDSAEQAPLRKSLTIKSLQALGLI